jgi:hypothetical protein
MGTNPRPHSERHKWDESRSTAIVQPDNEGRENLLEDETMSKLSKLVAVAALGLATLLPGLASAETVVVRPVGYYGAPVVERIRVGAPFGYWHPGFWRFHHGRYWR